VNTILEIPKLPSTVVLGPPLTDEGFEQLCAANGFAPVRSRGFVPTSPRSGASTRAEPPQRADLNNAKAAP